MSLGRPEGLSPSYNSIMSPDIPDSLYFRWTFRGDEDDEYQDGYTLTIWDVNDVQVHTETKYTWRTKVSAEAIAAKLVSGQTYWWRVEYWGEHSWNEHSITRFSEYAQFTYKLAPPVNRFTLDWPSVPKQGDVVDASVFFDDIIANAHKLVDFYDLPLWRPWIAKLFTGSVVPSRKDFELLERITDSISNQVSQSTPKLDIDGLIEGSLGATDLVAIREHLDMLANLPPHPPVSIGIEIDEPQMYSISNFVTSNENNIRVFNLALSWDVVEPPKSGGRLQFKEFSHSKVWYYECYFTYGPQSDPFTSKLFYLAEGMLEGHEEQVTIDFDGLFDDAEDAECAIYKFKVYAVNDNGKVSDSISATTSGASVDKIPGDIEAYEVEFQYASYYSMEDDWDVDGTWTEIYRGLDKTTTHNVKGSSKRRYFHRVRVRTDRGLKSSWAYAPGLLYKPQPKPSPPYTPPAPAPSRTPSRGSAPPPPSDVRVTNLTSSYAGTEIGATPGADGFIYTIKDEQGNVIKSSKGTRIEGVDGLWSNHKYTLDVQSYNEHGVSAPVSSEFRTFDVNNSVSNEEYIKEHGMQVNHDGFNRLIKSAESDDAFSIKLTDEPQDITLSPSFYTTTPPPGVSYIWERDKPPFEPTNIKLEAGLNSITISFDKNELANSYEYTLNDAFIYSGAANSFVATGLLPSTKYAIRVRAKNNYGYSDWVGMEIRTASARMVDTQTALSGKTWREDQTVWMREPAVAQGKDAIGTQQGIWFWDAAYWRTLLLGKTIVKVELYVERKKTKVGKGMPTFWLHNHAELPTGAPVLSDKHQAKEAVKDRGWVTLPNRYAENLRDGTATGIGVKADTGENLEHLKFASHAQLRITYE